MAHGKLKAIGTTAHLKQKFVARSHLRLRTTPENLAELQAHPEFPPAEAIDDGSMMFRISEEFDVAAAFRFLESARRQGKITDYSIVEPTLEEVFLAVTRTAGTSTSFVENEEADAGSLIEDRKCCGIDRRGHGILVYGAGSLAAFAFVTMILFRIKPNVYPFIIACGLAIFASCARSFFLVPGTTGADE